MKTNKNPWSKVIIILLLSATLVTNIIGIAFTISREQRRDEELAIQAEFYQKQIEFLQSQIELEKNQNTLLNTQNQELTAQTDLIKEENEILIQETELLATISVIMWNEAEWNLPSDIYREYKWNQLENALSQLKKTIPSIDKELWHTLTDDNVFQ